MRDKYSVRLLGGVSFEGPSGPVSGRPAQRRELALLAILAVASSRGVTRDKLVGCLWPDTSEETARHFLSNALYVLRREMGEESVHAAGDTVRLDPEIVWSDVGAFQEALAAGELEEAAASYSGPLLEGFYADAGPAFENWVDSERRRLALLYAEALESLADRAEAASEHARAAGWWQRLIAHDPYNSRAVLRLMQALAAAGDRANALQAATEHERLLKDELELQPAPEVLELARTLREEETAPAERKPRTKAPSPPEESQPRRRFLTRRSAALGIVVAVTLGSVVAAGFLVFGSSDQSFRAAAADFVDPQDYVVVAEFENETQRPALGATVRDAVAADLFQSGYVRVLGHNQARETLRLMRLPDTTRVDETLALEIARREGCPVVVAGTVALLGTGYSLTAAIIETETGTEVVRLIEMATDETEVIGAVGGLAGLVRRHLGEALPSIRRSEPLARYTTSSLEALELYTLAVRRADRSADWAAAIPLLEKAVALDTTFAEAYRKLWAYYGNLGNSAASYVNSELAYRFRERLTSREQLRIAGQYHADRGRLDSAAYYYGVLLGIYPESFHARLMLGRNLAVMGRSKEALESFRGALDVDPQEWRAAGNLAIAASALGQHELSDSGLAIVHEVLGRPYRDIEAYSVLSRGDFAAVDSLAREYVRDPDPEVVSRGWRWRAGLAAMYGRMDEARALAETAGLNSGTVWFIELALLAAGTPERALPYVDSLRRQPPLYPTLDEHQRLGFVAYGYALTGNVRSAREILAVMDSLSENDDFSSWFGIGERVLALIALQEKREVQAVEHLRGARAESFGYLAWDARLLMADAQAALGHFSEAIAQYEAVTGTYGLGYQDRYVYLALRPLAHETLGSLYLQVGDTVAAARHLAEFIELWNDADLELQPRVEAALRTLRALSPDA